ncbi:MAG: hypothetical protein AB1744_06025, partial [Candidatus Zixiibacteriota bacterium]
MPNLGVIISLLVVFGGLLWLGVRSILGREVERRVIFLLIFVAVAAPILFPITFEEHATPIVQRLFDRIENFPEGSTILMSFDFDPAMAPEVQPMAHSLTRHCLEKKHKVVFMCLWATGQSMLMTALDSIVRREFPDLVDGVDYINVGFKAGNEGVLNVIKSDFKK